MTRCRYIILCELWHQFEVSGIHVSLPTWQTHADTTQSGMGGGDNESGSRLLGVSLTQYFYQQSMHATYFVLNKILRTTKD